MAGAAIAWLLYMIMRWLVRHPAPKAEEGPDDVAAAMAALAALAEGLGQPEDEL